MGSFSFDELYKATGKFSADKIIGDGGFGTVYMGKLNDGSLVAIKRSKKVWHIKMYFSLNIFHLQEIKKRFFLILENFYYQCG